MANHMKLVEGSERRIHRRHDLLSQEIAVTMTEKGKKPVTLGHLIDLSAGGIRMRVSRESLRKMKLNSQIEVRIELPTFAGISPFIDRSGPMIRPKREWSGKMTVIRLSRTPMDEIEVGARLDTIDALDRGMLSLYLSTQPLAA